MEEVDFRLAKSTPRKKFEVARTFSQIKRENVFFFSTRTRKGIKIWREQRTVMNKTF